MPPPNIDSAGEKYSQFRQAYWEANAETLNSFHTWGQYYHRRLVDIYRRQVLPGQRVVEFGCGQGDLLAGVSPAFGLGIDFSAGMIRRARQRHPELNFVQADVNRLPVGLEDGQPFDVIILSDLLNELWDVQRVFEQAARLAGPHTRLVVNAYSRVWEAPLGLARRLTLARPILNSNWLTTEDISNLALLADFELLRHWSEFLFPLPVPGIAGLCNRYLVKFWPFNLLALTNFLVFRPRPLPVSPAYSVSVIIPARNEAGNIPEIFRRTPEMGSGSELIFVEGHSSDNTWQAIEAQMALKPARNCQLLHQQGAGKGDAVRLGFARAQGDILMVLDADLTVPPEDLPRFYAALASGKGEFINGVRLVYPLEKQAMRFWNFLGNKFFSVAFSWLIGQPVKDTLCGTKVLWRRDYQRIAANREYFGDFDPFGDFDLIFGAVRLQRKIVDLPVRYRERVYGTTNIRRWKHGWLLLRMLSIAARRLKFI
jgi:ubiquinone/menaquinone biosynthesis C-methylase UbiE